MLVALRKKNALGASRSPVIDDLWAKGETKNETDIKRNTISDVGERQTIKSFVYNNKA